MCSWLRPFHPFDQGGSQEHISLCLQQFFNDPAFNVQFKHKQKASSWLY